MVNMMMMMMMDKFAAKCLHIYIYPNIYYIGISGFDAFQLTSSADVTVWLISMLLPQFQGLVGAIYV